MIIYKAKHMIVQHFSFLCKCGGHFKLTLGEVNTTIHHFYFFICFLLKRKATSRAPSDIRLNKHIKKNKIQKQPNKKRRPDSSVGRHDMTDLDRPDHWRCVFIRTAPFNNIFEAVFAFFDYSDMSH
ncbi:hypothetical protein BpHYR1_009348 [Brachionus plicatilis]|uniref:Uncharacterized protein n=1 Tax=Brachionus plicatilis TaxID=10195 RepID=A0A3M7SXK7_BRAPC|nr:hypothetical protein BpHYR1_009348 [Brachionus plicatilis]